MTTTTRATLLERLRDGENALAWDEFFACYWPTIYGFARHRGCSEHTAEEIVQDVMLKVFQQRDVYQYDPDRGRFRDWLAAVIRNQVAEYRRRPANRLRAVGGEANVDVLEQVGEEQEPDAAWEEAFENSLLLALLDAVRRETNARSYLAFELVSLMACRAARRRGSPASRGTPSTRPAARFPAAGGAGRPYREEGRLAERVKRAMELRPPAGVERC